MHVKYFFILLFVFVLQTSSLLFGQTYNCQWIEKTGSLKIVADDENNVFIVKALAPGQTFNYFGSSITSVSYSFIIVKFNSEMELLWVKQYASEYSSQINSVKISSDGLILLAGLLSFDSDDLSLKTRNKGELVQGFAAEFNSQGEVGFVWLVEGNDILGSDITTDSFGNLYLTANYTDSLFIADTALASNDYLGPISTGIILKYDLSKQFLWASSAYPNLMATFNFAETDIANNLFVAGQSEAYQWSSIFIAQYNQNGDRNWLVQNSTPWSENFSVSSSCNGLSVDKQNSDAYINLMNYGPLVLDGLSLNTGGYQYVAKFNSTGNIEWFKSLGGSPGYGTGGIYFRNDTLFFAGMLSDSFYVINHNEYPQGFANAHFGGFNTDGELIMYKRSHSTSSTVHYASSILSVGENIYVSLVNENSYPVTDSAYFDEIGFFETGNYLAKFKYDLMSGILNCDGKSDLSILPNPASEFVEIVLPVASSLNIEVAIYNQFGGTISKLILPSNIESKLRVNIDSYQSGLYYVVIKIGNQIYSKKFVKL